jgi:small subunit ribosomal protein S25e
MAPKVQKSKEAKIKAALAGGKGKKKKWSKGKQKDKVVNAVMFDKALWDKLTKEIPKAKLITPSIISERIKINGSLARQAIRVLEEQGQIVRVGEPSSKLQIYTRKVTSGTA